MALRRLAREVDSQPIIAQRIKRLSSIELDTENQRTLVRGFRSDELEQANAQYLELERKMTPTTQSDAVLVSVENIAVLQRAYPNYFLDTRAFLDMVREALPKTLIRQPRTAPRSSSLR
jgi:hypothetical protein